MNNNELDNYGRPKKEYLDKLVAMNDAQLFNETDQKIWLSGYANNNPRSDYHWQCDATYDEWKSRGKVEQYKIAHAKVVASVS